MDHHQKFVAEIVGCTACRLCVGRTNVVVFRGRVSAPILLIGESPEDKEDQTGIPFVGNPGRLLHQLLEQSGLPQDDVYLTTLVKCQTPNNRVPRLEEIRSCNPYLERQIQLIQPLCIITAGKVATQIVTGVSRSMRTLMSMSALTCVKSGVPVMPIPHLSELMDRLDDSSAAPLFQDTVLRLVKVKEWVSQTEHPAEKSV